MPREPIEYSYCCYCMVCQEDFYLSSSEEMACCCCGSRNSFVILSKKKETEREIIEKFKKEVSFWKRIAQEAYLDGFFQESEEEDLDRLKKLKDIENFFKKNPNPKKEKVLKILSQKLGPISRK